MPLSLHRLEAAPRPAPAAARGAGAAGRFELRAFAPRMERVRARMRRRGLEVATTTHRTHYLLGRGPDVSLKVREGRLEVERRLETRGALERWAAEAVRPLPLDPDWARRALPALLGLPELAGLGEEPVSLRELVLRLAPAAGVDVVTVQEVRQRFRLGRGVRGEVARGRVAGLTVDTAAVQSASPSALRRSALLVGLDPASHTSWPAALRSLHRAPEGLAAHARGGEGA